MYKPILISLFALIANSVSHYYPATSYQQVYFSPAPAYRPYLYRPYYTNHIVAEEKPTKVIKDEGAVCKLNSRISSVPLVVVKEDDVNIVKVFNDNPYQETLVELLTQDQRVPAVRVVLPEPLILQDIRTSIPFPSGFTILEHGSRTPLPILTVLAPVSDYYYPGSVYGPAYRVKPYQVNVVYAVPIRYPAYQPVRPLYQPSSVYYRPYPSYVQSSKPLYTQTVKPVNTTTTVIHPQQKPDNLVTVLEFPNAVASPDVLYYQEISSENELGNRNPPQPVIPSGIVQSVAPQPQLTVFVNAKESPFLQTLRDEAEKNKQKVTNKEAIVEAVY